MKTFLSIDFLLHFFFWIIYSIGGIFNQYFDAFLSGVIFVGGILLGFITAGIALIGGAVLCYGVINKDHFSKKLGGHITLFFIGFSATFNFLVSIR